MDMLATVLPLALVVGLSPLPIMPAVLLLMTPRGRANSLAYLGAWLVALTALVCIALTVGSTRDPAPATDQQIGWIGLITGAAFLVIAAVKWRRRPRPGEPKDPPAWLAALGGYSVGKSARLGALMAAGNPKVIAMALAAGAELSVLTEGSTEALIGVVGFVVIGSLGVAAPILVAAALGERAQPSLQSAKEWLDRNSTILGVGVLVALGVILLLRGLPTVG